MKRRTFVGVAGATAVGALAGCTAPTAPETTDEGTGGEAGETTMGQTTAGGGEGGGGGTQSVAMVTGDNQSYYFDPIGLFVEPGTTVEWVNESGAHSSTAYAAANDAESRIPSDAEAWDSGILSDEGATFEHTFETAGTYDYFCLPHKTLGMVGRIVVGEPGGPATEGPPPDGEVPASDVIVDQGAVSYEEFSG